MPGRNAAEEEQIYDAAEDASSPKTLSFHQSLSWRAGKPIAVGELLRRLETLASELANIDQEDDEFDRTSLRDTAKELAHSNLLTHKDKGVRALTACCLVDVFRICAPDAPFDTPQMQGIFDLLVSHIIPLLQDPTDPYNARHLFVLKSIADYKTMILLGDLPRPDKLILKLFHTCFDILANPVEGLSKNVEYLLSVLLQGMVEECETLPPAVVDAILIQFLRADPGGSTTSAGKGKKAGSESTRDERQPQLQFNQLPSAYHAAKTICNSCEDRMARLVSQYFSNVIVDASTSRRKVHAKSKSQRKSKASEVDESDTESLGDPSEDDLKQLEKAHRLLREIWRCSPGVLQNVIPQIEAELSAENLQIRRLATEAMGDMVSGIGAAGPPPRPVLDPAAYPPLSLSDPVLDQPKLNDAYVPSSSRSFSQCHPSAYQNFIGRRNDKAPEIRAAWSGKIGHILSTSAGGLGLSPQEDRDLAQSLALLLIDVDETVRLAAIDALTLLDFRQFISKLGPLGGMSNPGSLLSNLADRVKDRKHQVRAKATRLLGRLWGVSAAEIAAGNEQVISLLGPIPSKILNAIYANDVEINALVDEVLFDALIPLGYPNLKKKKDSSKNGSSSGTKSGNSVELDADRVRAERLLLLCKDLDQRAKSVLLALMGRPALLSNYMKAFLRRCEDYNGGVMEQDGPEIKQHLSKLIDYFSKTLPDQAKVSEDLWKFAKMHDRRFYTLIRFCMADDSDYQKIHKSFKELKRRFDSSSGITATLPNVIQMLLFRVSNWFYNRSHIRPIMEFAQDEQHDLAPAAQELLKDISSKNPGAFKAHGQELCNYLEEHAPRNGRECDSGALDALKACSSFAKKYPENVPKKREFLQAMMQYALRGSPASTAKYAVSIILCSTDKKEMYVKDILRNCVEGYSYGEDHFLARLASLSQVMLEASKSFDETEDIDPALDIALQQVLSKNRPKPTSADASWDDKPGEECEAKMWALKILVNRLLSYEDAESVQDISQQVYQLLNRLITNQGELTKTSSTPPSHKSRLRLQAALLQLKLCSHGNFDTLLTPTMFDAIATVAQDAQFEVREAFVTKIKKYLGQNRLPSRFYCIIFLLAFEPTRKLQRESSTWLRARANAFGQVKKGTMEALLARFLSLLAHHPDFSSDADEMKDLIQYIMFYLQATATAENISLIYHVAQQVKTVQDGVNPEASDNLYYLADLAVAAITHFAHIQNWSLQAPTGKVRFPSGIFAPIPDHDTAQEIAMKRYLPADAFDEVEGMVKALMKSKKRKADGELHNGTPKKRPGPSSSGNHARSTRTQPSGKLNSKKQISKKTASRAREANADKSSASVERRRSGRNTGLKSYAEEEDSDNDAERDAWDQEDGSEEVSPATSRISDGNKENSGIPRGIISWGH